MESIVVIMAMEAEAVPFIERIGAVPTPLPTLLPLRGFIAEFDGCRVSVVVNGRHPRHGVDHIGTDAAAIATSIAIAHCGPELVITAGTAGGRRGSTQRLGDVVIAAGHFVYHDRRIPLPGFEELGIGRFPAASLDDVARALGLATGVFSTGNSFGETVEDLVMIDASGAIAIDMESAAVAAVCELFAVPVTGVRVIGNFIDDPASVADFETGLVDSADVLAAALVDVIAHWSGRDG